MPKLGTLGSLFAFMRGRKPDPASAAPPTDPASGDATFATSLYQRLARQPGNLFFSPASVRMALGMTYAGARGDTASEMRRALALPPGKEAHDLFAAQLKRWDILANPVDAQPQGNLANDPEMRGYYADQLERRRVTLRIVNRIWSQSGHPLSFEFLSLLAEAYRAPPAQLDFKTRAEPSRVAINEWVSENTATKIPELIARDLISADTRLVLTNAIYFKARWSQQFRKEATREQPFFVSATEKVPVPMMRQVHHFHLGTFRDGQVLELSYGGGDLSMVIVLPSKVDGLPAIEAQLADGALPEWLGSMKGVSADVSLPRFKVSTAFLLAEVLKGLGMGKPFTWPGADFSGIDGTKELVISEVVHQALVEVDELGTEAAAATAVVAMLTKSTPREEKPVVFRADRPFLFLIREVKSGVLLFVGRLVRPGA